MFFSRAWPVRFALVMNARAPSTTHRIGNLVLLHRRKNSEASNLDFAEKKMRASANTTLAPASAGRGARLVAAAFTSGPQSATSRAGASGASVAATLLAVDLAGDTCIIHM